jgi:hypothetical protein
MIKLTELNHFSLAAYGLQFPLPTLNRVRYHTQPKAKYEMRSVALFRGCNPYPNVVKKWLEFTRAIERDRVKGRYTERVSKSCNHQPQSMVSYQEINSTLLGKGDCNNGEGKVSRGACRG